MQKHFDEFSRKLAGGVSRRRALWQTLTGAGGLGLLASTNAAATPTSRTFDPSCPGSCFQQSNIAFTACVEDVLVKCPSTPFGAVIGICIGVQTALYQKCLTASLCCPPGLCATVYYTLGNGDIKVNNVTCQTTKP